MDIKGLNCFVSVYEAKSFARAAVLLHTTQSTVSARIRKLEEFFGEPLFHRMHRSILPTAKGEKLYLHAKAVLERADEAVKALANDEAA